MPDEREGIENVRALWRELGALIENYDWVVEPPVEPPPIPTPLKGVWLSKEEIMRIPMDGPAWDRLFEEATLSIGRVDLADQDGQANTTAMAKALVFARTGNEGFRQDVVEAIGQLVRDSYGGRALALGRNLCAFIIAADLIDLATYRPELDQEFRAKLRDLRTTPTPGAASDLIDAHENRPNNWGAMAGATRAAIAVYLEDQEELERTAQVFKGYLGDRSSYDGFTHGGPWGERDLSWNADPDNPVGINPAGAERDGFSIDGVLPDDQRRGGSFSTNPPKENYVWEALQGLVAQAVILDRAGYPVWDWEDQALLRAVRWLHEVLGFPAEGDDTWIPHIINYVYETDFPAPVPSRHGKVVGFTDWTHG